jgi:hypothetical protein
LNIDPGILETGVGSTLTNSGTITFNSNLNVNSSTIYNTGMLTNNAGTFANFGSITGTGM